MPAFRAASLHVVSLSALALAPGLARADDDDTSSPSSSSSKATFRPGIPSNEHNPFIEQSKLPEGTLFIACGSILLGLFIMGIIWRFASVLQMRRVARKSEARFTALTQNAYGGPFMDPVLDGGASTDAAAADIDEKKRKGEPVRQLFFSPIKEVMRTGNLVAPLANQTSYLPAGYYAPAVDSNRNSRPFSMVREGGVSRVSLAEQSSGHDSGAGGFEIAGTDHAGVAAVAAAENNVAGIGPGSTRRQQPPSKYLDELLDQA